MSTCEILIDTTFAALNATSTGQGGINLVLGDEHSHLCDLCHIGSVFTSRQVKVLQSVPNLNGLVIVETHHITVCFVGIHKSGAISRDRLTESRVFQILCQASCCIGKTAFAVVTQRIEDILFSGFIA